MAGYSRASTAHVHTRLVLRSGSWLLGRVAARRLQLADIVAEKVIHGDELVKVAVWVEQKLREAQRSTSALLACQGSAVIT